MEAYKTFENLSDSAKVKFFEVLGCLNNASKETSTNVVESSASPQKSDLGVLLEHLKGVPKTLTIQNINTDKSSPSAENSKKQKTLDGWLIKRNQGASSSKIREIPSEVGTVNVNSSSLDDNILVNCSFSLSNDNNVIHSIHASQKFPTETPSLRGSKFVNYAVESSKDGFMENDGLTISSSSRGETCYTLRRSQRKLSKLTTHDKSGDSTSEHINIYSDNIKKFNKIEKDVKSTFIENETSQVSQKQKFCTRDVNNLDSNLHANSNIIQSPEKCTGFENLNSINYSSESKTSYNLRTKRKIAKISQDEIKSEIHVSSNISDQHILIDQRTEINVSPIIDTFSQLNYEAFCEVSALCSQFGLNVHDILQDEKLKNILNNHENDISNDGIVLIGTHKSRTGKILPIVHTHVSKLKLSENLCEIQKTLLEKK